MFGLFNKNSININDEKISKLKKGQLIDVREINEFKEGHLPNAINIPSNGLILNFASLLKNKEQTYYIYCLSGQRAGRVCNTLTKNGYNVINAGGIMSYEGKIQK